VVEHNQMEGKRIACLLGKIQQQQQQKNNNNNIRGKKMRMSFPTQIRQYHEGLMFISRPWNINYVHLASPLVV